MLSIKIIPGEGEVLVIVVDVLEHDPALPVGQHRLVGEGDEGEGEANFYQGFYYCLFHCSGLTSGLLTLSRQYFRETFLPYKRRGYVSLWCNLGRNQS